MSSRASSRSVRPKDLLPPVNFGRALLFASGGAVIGAVAWGVILKVTNYEIVYLAWGIGALVGVACVKGGGYGGGLASASAVLALLSIVCGKAFGFQMIQPQVVEEIAAELGSQMDYEMIQMESAEWVALGDSPSTDAVRSFMTENDYQAEDGPEGAGVRQGRRIESGQGGDCAHDGRGSCAVVR